MPSASRVDAGLFRRTNLEDFDGAVADCEQALVLNPLNSRAYGRLGSAHYKAGRFAQSKEAYAKALEIDPGNLTYSQGHTLSSQEGDRRQKQQQDKGSAPAPKATLGVDQTAKAIEGLLKAAGGSGAGGASRQQGSSRDDAVDYGVGMARSMQAMALYNEAKELYTRAWGGQEEEEGREGRLEETHMVVADKCLELARRNGGIYNKAAQFVASLQGGAGDKGVPKTFVKTLAVLTDSAPFKPFSVMRPVLVEDFGEEGIARIFSSIDEAPIAAASLAQVGCLPSCIYHPVPPNPTPSTPSPRPKP